MALNNPTTTIKPSVSARPKRHHINVRMGREKRMLPTSKPVKSGPISFPSDAQYIECHGWERKDPKPEQIPRLSFQDREDPEHIVC